MAIFILYKYNILSTTIMYINKIDDLLSKIIDDFYISTKAAFDKLNLESEFNFVKYQKDINDILFKYTQKINVDEFRELLKNEDNVKMIVEIVKRYLAYYVFLIIASFYSGKDDTYINNIVEFTKNQASFPLKISNFFNSENNANIIKNYKTVKNIQILLNITDKAKLSVLVGRPDFHEALDFLNNLGQDFVLDNFINKKLNLKERNHNIVKTLIILNIYKKQEKKEVFRILESVESSGQDGEYIFIDVIYPIKQFIDYSSVEQVMTQRELISGLSYEFWRYISEHEEGKIQALETIDEKILKLINSGIIIPITDDFMLFHKDNEKYDKTESDKIKKKEDTKIRYIVTKLDSVADYYSENNKKDNYITVKKNFYTPLNDRKAVLVNRNEEIKIINKLINQGKKSLENNEYLHDLTHYRNYPYVNFKDISGTGFSILLDKTVNAVRSVSLDTKDYKQNKRSPLQMRVGAKDQIINVIGFLIPTNMKHMNCIRVKDALDLKTLAGEDTKYKNVNGYNLTIEYLKHSKLNLDKHKSTVFWKFNIDEDIIKLDTYEQATKLNNQEQFKLIISKLYDDIVQELYFMIYNKINDHKTLNINSSYKIKEFFENKTMPIPQNYIMYHDLLEKIYFENNIVTDSSYDIKDDIFHGIGDNILELPYAPEPRPPNVPTVKIDISEEVSKETFGDKEEVIGVCQHNITWEKIFALRKSNPNKYSDLLYEFIQHYVIENAEQDYVCKSCGVLLNIKKYIIDGTYDDETQRYVTFSMPMDVPLEDIPEYEKLKVSIRNIDKIIEKISNISNIPYFLGNSITTRTRRKGVTKDTIDIVGMNNKYLKNNFKERNELASKIYGVSRDLSNLFIFELDNNIFVFSSKEKDYYKKIKLNNIIAYIIVLMILEINDSHITFMGGDKKGLCNFEVFDKYGHVLFDGLKIRKNRSGDLDSIKNYRILCFMIYIISCMATKYNLWAFEIKEDRENKQEVKVKGAPKKKFNPTVQKIIIHTVVDILNSVLENSTNKDAHYLYEIISTKFYSKLNTTFNSSLILSRLRTDTNKNINSLDKKSYVITKSAPILIKDEFEFIKDYLDPEYNTCRLPKYYIAKRNVVHKKYNYINGITNCPTGEFHKWVPDAKTMKCSICNLTLEYVMQQNTTDQDKELSDKFRYIQLQQLAQKYCSIDTQQHNFKFDRNSGTYICIKCKKPQDYTYNNKELDHLEKLLNKKTIDLQKLLNTKDNTEESAYGKKVLQKLETLYQSESPKEKEYSYLNKFVETIQNVVGTDINIGQNTHFKDNIYVVDHDHLGYPLDTPIYITDKDNKMIFKSNHPFFKTDVLYYTNMKTGRIDVFYDATNFMLLGYKEASKDFTLSRNPNKRLRMNYSIYNKLKLMGYPSQYINIENMKQDYIKYDEKKQHLDLEALYQEIIRDILRQRISNLKKVIYEFQRFINRIKYNYITGVQEKHESDDKDVPEWKRNSQEEEAEAESVINQIIKKYHKKLSNVNLSDSKNEHKVFKHWKVIAEELFTNDISDINIRFDKKLISAEYLNTIDNSSRILLYYIITEMHKLIDYNSNKFIKTNLVNFYLEFINIIFDMFNNENIINNFEVKKFLYMLKSSFYLHELEQNSMSVMSTDFYGEYKDPDEKVQDVLEGDDDPNDKNKNKTDDKEEADALDIDVDPETIDPDVDGSGDFGYESMNDAASHNARFYYEVEYDPKVADSFGE